MTEQIAIQDTPVQPAAEGTFKRIFLAPGRAMVAVHNAMSSRHRRLEKGHWSYNIAAWACAGILWFVVLAVAIGIPAAMILAR